MAEDRTTHFGYREVAEKDKAGMVAERVPLGGGALRPDERPDVGRHPPPLEALHHRAERRARGPARAGHRRRHRRSRGALRRTSWAARGSRGARGHQRVHARHRPQQAAGPRSSAPMSISCRPMPSSLPFPDDEFRLHHHRLRPAQRHATRSAPWSSMLRVLSPGGRLLVLEFSKPTSELLEQALRCLFLPACCPGSASWWPMTRRATSTWPNRSACIRTRKRCRT